MKTTILFVSALLSSSLAIAMGNGGGGGGSGGGGGEAGFGVEFTDISDEINFSHVTLPEGEGFGGAAIFDYDSDGDMDIYMTNGAGHPSGLFENNGNGFSNVTVKAGVLSTAGNSGVTSGDLNNDGYPELILSGDGGLIEGDHTPTIVYLNNGPDKKGKVTFTDVTATAGIVDADTGATISLADLDKDGYLDVFIGAHGKFGGGTNEDPPFGPVASEHKLFRNNGDMTFTDITASAGLTGGELGACSNGFTDYDNDGDLDLLIANCNDPIRFTPESPGEPPVQLFKNVSNGSNIAFVESSQEAGLAQEGGGWMGVAFADYNSDGNIDVFLTNTGINPAPFAFGPHGLFEN